MVNAFHLGKVNMLLFVFIMCLIALSDEIFNKKVTIISSVYVLIKMVKYLFFNQKKDNKYGTMVRQ